MQQLLELAVRVGSPRSLTRAWLEGPHLADVQNGTDSVPFTAYFGHEGVYLLAAHPSKQGRLR